MSPRVSESLASVIAAVSSCVMFTHNSGCVSSLRQRDRGDIVACLLREVCSLLREFANIAFVNILLPLVLKCQLWWFLLSYWLYTTVCFSLSLWLHWCWNLFVKPTRVSSEMLLWDPNTWYVPTLKRITHIKQRIQPSLSKQCLLFHNDQFKNLMNVGWRISSNW